jgi:hypothetical protein
MPDILHLILTIVIIMQTICLIWVSKLYTEFRSLRHDFDEIFMAPLDDEEDSNFPPLPAA